MEQQIAERAMEYARALYPDMRDEELQLFSDCRRDYAHGAREQKKIDIEKACEWLEEISIGDYAWDDCQNAPSHTDNKSLVNDFRKAMGG